MTNKAPIEVNNANISEIMHSSMANTKGNYYQLTEDIVLSGWITAENFGGTLDGNGHTITLKDDSSCFLHYLSTTGTLQNIGFLGEISSSVGDLASSGDAYVVANSKGANSIEWVAGENGYPILKNGETQKQYTVSFKKQMARLLIMYRKMAFL